MKTIHQNGSATIDRYFYKDIEQEFNIKSTARADRINAAVDVGAMSPIQREGRTPFVSAEQMAELRYQNDYLAKGGTLQSYKELRSQKADETESLAITEASAELDKYWGDKEVDQDLDTILRNAFDAFNMNPRLTAYAQLELYIKSNLPITDDELISLFGWKPPRTGFTEHKYRFVYLSTCYVAGEDRKPVKQKAWKIEKIDLEAIHARKSEAKKLAAGKRKQEKEKLEEQAAIANYEAVKEMLVEEREEF